MGESMVMGRDSLSEGDMGPLDLDDPCLYCADACLLGDADRLVPSGVDGCIRDAIKAAGGDSAALIYLALDGAGGDVRSCACELEVLHACISKLRRHLWAPCWGGGVQDSSRGCLVLAVKSLECQDGG